MLIQLYTHKKNMSGDACDIIIKGELYEKDWIYYL